MNRLAPEHAVLVNLLLRPAEDRGRGGADVQDLTRRDRNRPYDIRQRGDDAPQPLAKRLELSFRLAAGAPLFSPSQPPPPPPRQAQEGFFLKAVAWPAPVRVCPA